jgi:transcriptional regulator with XRE-family HTH domain
MLREWLSDFKYRQTDAMTYERTAFGERLRASREATKLTQKQVSEAIGISQGNLAGLEREGLGSSFTPQLATLYGVDAHWLATGEHALGERPSNWLDSHHRKEGTKSRGELAQLLSHPHVSHRPPIFRWETMVIDELPNEFLVAIPDESLAPRLRAGHVVRFDRTIDARPGDCVLVADSRGDLYVRFFRAGRAGTWHAYPINEDFETFHSDRDSLRLVAVFTGMEGRLG